MKRFNFNIKDRKMLYGILSIVLVCVFTLTIAYAALNTILTISGNAQVSSSDWDIHLANPKITNGSATTDIPVIKTSSTLEFSTTLNMPGDFFEFTVDVVNGGSIDAMIENVVKTPELTAEQAKYLNYKVTYQNGDSVEKKQTLTHGTTIPIKVRIEYRNDLVASDLPTGQVVLDLSLTLEYVQSDGSGSTVNGENVVNSLDGKSVAFYGDSVTLGARTSNISFADYISADNNMTFAKFAQSSYTAYNMKDLMVSDDSIAYLQTLTNEDYVIVTGFYNNVTNKHSATQIRSQINAIINAYKNGGYVAKLGFVLLPVAPSQDAELTRELWDAAISLFNESAISYLDLYSMDCTFLSDKLHQDEQGQRTLAETIANWMKTF